MLNPDYHAALLQNISQNKVRVMLNLMDFTLT